VPPGWGRLFWCLAVRCRTAILFFTASVSPTNPVSDGMGSSSRKRAAGIAPPRLTFGVCAGFLPTRLYALEQGEIGPDLFRAACKMGLEGLVSKRRDRPYRAGRSPNWIKVKNRNHPAMSRVRDSF
jgi:hypothetical protein